MLGATANPGPADCIPGSYDSPCRGKEIVADRNIVDRGKAADWNKKNCENSEKHQQRFVEDHNSSKENS